MISTLEEDMELNKGEGGSWEERRLSSRISREGQPPFLVTPSEGKICA